MPAYQFAEYRVAVRFVCSFKNFAPNGIAPVVYLFEHCFMVPASLVETPEVELEILKMAQPGGMGQPQPRRRRVAAAGYLSPYDVSLPLPEIIFYALVWIGHSLYAFYYVWAASPTYRNRIYGGFFEPGWAILGAPRKDVSNYEWQIWSAQVVRYLPWFFGHLLLFNLGPRLFAQRQNWRPGIFLYWLAANYFIYKGPFVLLVTIGHGFVMQLITQLRIKILVWITAILLLASLSFDSIYGVIDRELYYEFMVFFAYKLLQYISYSLYAIDQWSAPAFRPHNEDADDKQLKRDERFVQQNCISYAYNMFWYAFYLPYNISLIVLYKDFVQQIELRAQRSLCLSELLSLALRVSAWCLFNDLVPHFLYMNALMTDFTVLQRIGQTDLVLLAAVGYTAGQYFHTKYVSIFGVPTFFAKCDRMEPPWPPICISRVSLYSRMWRQFDRGLYSFLKELIFLPIVRCNFLAAIPPVLVRIVATALSFGFVCVWHGATTFYFIWVCLNFVEVLLEASVKSFYRQPHVFSFFARYLSHRMIRRVTAFAHNVCVAFGILSIFFFIGGTESGQVFVQRFLFDSAPFGFPFLYLLGLGYCFNQFCIEIDRWENR